MAIPLFEELRAKLARREKELQKIKFKVLVWGPGSELFWKKRQEVIEELRQHGFQAFTSEELSQQIPSTLPLIEQERLHWELSDLVIVFDQDVAPAMELAAFCSSPDFCKKCIVFHPKKYDPTEKTTFPSGILKLFGNLVPYTEEEIARCVTTRLCLQKALAYRRYKSII